MYTDARGDASKRSRGVSENGNAARPSGADPPGDGAAFEL